MANVAHPALHYVDTNKAAERPDHKGGQKAVAKKFVFEGNE